MPTVALFLTIIVAGGSTIVAQPCKALHPWQVPSTSPTPVLCQITDDESPVTPNMIPIVVPEASSTAEQQEAEAFVTVLYWELQRVLDWLRDQ